MLYNEHLTEAAKGNYISVLPTVLQLLSFPGKCGEYIDIAMFSSETYINQN